MRMLSACCGKVEHTSRPGSHVTAYSSRRCAREGIHQAETLADIRLLPTMGGEHVGDTQRIWRLCYLPTPAAQMSAT
jgi:hypothetical protein